MKTFSQYTSTKLKVSFENYLCKQQAIKAFIAIRYTCLLLERWLDL